MGRREGAARPSAGPQPPPLLQSSLQSRFALCCCSFSLEVPTERFLRGKKAGVPSGVPSAKALTRCSSCPPHSTQSVTPALPAPVQPQSVSPILGFTASC